MANLTKSTGRTRIDVAEASEIARTMRGGPDMLAREDMEELLGDSALVLDGLRRRPRYFDGRFLTGADLTRDQDYIRRRQGDLARATGTGVVSGLEVGLSGAARGELLTIEAGHGVTPSGDIVTILSRRQLAPLDLPAVDRLDATLGLRAEPRVSLGRRSGLFLLALRAVEFTANPIAAYPTSISGPRRIEDGDVIEATAVTLIPWPDTGAAATLAEARRIVARQIFLGDASGSPQDALSLAMIAMDRGAIRWIDTAMVRRETGADTPLQVSMGARPRALAEAFVLQHRRHLGDVLRDRAMSGLPPSFAAAQYFAALPAAGQLPAAAILPDAMGFRQSWFPPAVDVDLSFIPSDEVAALVEESLALPPIDLMGEPEDLDATSIAVLMPVTRQRLQRFERALTKLTAATLPDPGQGIRRAPALMLAAMLARNSKLLEARSRDAEALGRAEAVAAETRTWHAAWAEAAGALPTDDGAPPLVWYVRRRAVAYRADATGIAVAVSGDDRELERTVAVRMTELGFAGPFSRLSSAATPFAMARVLAFLGAPRIAGSDTLSSAAMRDLEAAIPDPRLIPRPTGPLEPLGPLPIEPPIGLIETPVVLPPVADPPAPSGGATPPAPGTSPGGVVPPIRPDIVVTPPIRPPIVPIRPRPDIGVLVGPGLVRPQALRPGLNRLAVARAPATASGGPLRVTEADVVDIASDYGSSRLGDGLDRIAAALGTQPLTREDAVWLGGTGHALEIDRMARDLGAAGLSAFAGDLRGAVTARDAAAVERLLGG